MVLPPRPAVTVIVPAYNAAKLLVPTLESLRAQTFSDWECLVVDDGSTDGTPRLVEEIAARDPRFRLISQNNRGVGAARNTAIERARGHYIAPLDADDLWSPEKLERQVARMEAAGEACGLVYCWSRRVDAGGRMLCGNGEPGVEGEVFEALVERNFIGNASVPLFRAEALAEVGCYLTRDEQGGFQGCEDWDLALRVAREFEVAAIREPLVGYRRGRGSMSCDVLGMAGSYRAVVRCLRRREPLLSPALLRRSAAIFHAYLVSEAYCCGKHREALRLIARTPGIVMQERVGALCARSLVKLAFGSDSAHPRPSSPAPPMSPAGRASARRGRITRNFSLSEFLK